MLQLRGGTGELKKLFKNKGVFTHCFVNLMLFVILTALAYKFNIESLLYSSFSSVTGAGAADMNVWYLYYKIAPFLLIVIVPASIYFLMKSKHKPAAASLAVFPAVWIAAVICAVVFVFLSLWLHFFHSRFAKYNRGNRLWNLCGLFFFLL